MDKSVFWITTGLCGLVPVLLIVAAIAFFILSPLLKAPSKAKVLKAARKRLKWDEGVTRDQLREHLRDRFYPDWARRGPRADSEVLRSGALFGVFGIPLGICAVFFEMFGQMRWSVLSMVIDGRIDAAIDSLLQAEDGRRHRRSRGRGY